MTSEAKLRLRPVHENVLVKLDPPPETFERDGQLAIPEKHRERHRRTGTITAVGWSVPPDLQIGMRVTFPFAAGWEFPFEGEVYYYLDWRGLGLIIEFVED